MECPSVQPASLGHQSHSRDGASATAGGRMSGLPRAARDPGDTAVLTPAAPRGVLRCLPRSRDGPLAAAHALPGRDQTLGFGLKFPKSFVGFKNTISSL